MLKSNINFRLTFFRELLKLSLPLFLLNSCGTDTGNPGFSNWQITPPHTSIDYHIHFEICAKVSQCFGSSPNCYVQAPYESHFVQALNLSTDDYSNLVEIYSAVEKSQVIVNPVDLLICKASVKSLSCTSAIVQDSFDMTRPGDFSNLQIMLNSSPNCKNSFSKKQ